MKNKKGGEKVKALKTKSVEDKERIMNVLRRYVHRSIQRSHFKVFSFSEFCGGQNIIKFSIANNDGYKTILYASSLPDLIKALQELEAHLNKEVVIDKDGGGKGE